MKVRILREESAYRYYVSDEVKRLCQMPRSDYFVKYVDAFFIEHPRFYVLGMEYFEVNSNFKLFYLIIIQILQIIFPLKGN